MTTPHPFVADGFFIAGAALFLVKFVTWEEARVQASRVKLIFAGVVITLVILVIAIGGNHALDRSFKRPDASKPDVIPAPGPPNTPVKRNLPEVLHHPKILNLSKVDAEILPVLIEDRRPGRSLDKSTQPIQITFYGLGLIVKITNKNFGSVPAPKVIIHGKAPVGWGSILQRFLISPAKGFPWMKRFPFGSGTSHIKTCGGRLGPFSNRRYLI